MIVRAMAGPLSKSGRRRIPNTTKVRGYSTPPPVKGWNARDSLANMDEADAIRLDNWFPKESWVEVRRGFDSHATGLVGAVESLMSWTGPSSSKLFAAANTAIYEVTTAGAVGAADVSSMTNDRWQHVMFGTSAGSYLYIVNGADDPRHYDGSSWTVPSLTGMTAANLIHINAFKRRLFFIEKNSLSFWYLAVDSIAGALTEFDLGPLCGRGGYLMAMGTWTIDGGAGVDDLAVFVTSAGEVVVYQGTDPGSATTWSLVGVYRIGAPIGRRCLVRIGGDLVIVSEDGFAQLSRFIAAGRATTKAAMSDRISGAVVEAVRDHRLRFGWQPILYPAGNMVLFNVPTGSTSVQYVSNSTTGAWCRFTGQPAWCWEIHDDALYFGGTAAVYLADSGLDDNGADIDTSAKPAFSYFGDRGRKKRIAMVRPNFGVDGAITVAMLTNVDFEDNFPTTTPSFTPTGGGEWDTAVWDEAVWGDGVVISQDWQGVTGIGHCATIRIKTASQNGTIRWNATDWLIEPVASAGYI